MDSIHLVQLEAFLSLSTKTIKYKENIPTKAKSHGGSNFEKEIISLTTLLTHIIIVR